MGQSERFLSKETCEAIVRRVVGFAQGRGETLVEITSWWQGELRWARNRVSLASDRRDIRITVWRRVSGHGEWFGVTTNQTDEVSLESAVRAAERRCQLEAPPGIPSPFEPPIPELVRPQTAIWSAATYTLTTESRGELVRAMIGPAEAKGLLSAGYLELRGASRMRVSSARPTGPYAPWEEPYVQWTQAQCSLTVRDETGSASGWAGLSGYDWRTIDARALAERALEKALAARNPVTLEPGRYTVILEPQAVADLLEILVGSMGRLRAEEFVPRNQDDWSPWTLGYDNALRLWRTKLGLKVVDERVTLSHDPADPELGILPEPGMEPVTWIDHGVLTNLAYDREYALARLNRNEPLRGMTGYRMSGGDTSIEEMIRTTKRGLLVTRFWNVGVLQSRSLLSTGVTRDGLWLIENGRVTKAVKNFRFTESPLFVLNSLEQLGPPVRVFRPTKQPGGELTPAIVPPLKARDFSFTSTIDAI